MTPTLTYVYCLVRHPGGAPDFDVPAAMPDADAVRALDAGDGLWLIVSRVPAAAYGEAALAEGLQDIDWVGPRALAHEAVVECFIGAPALVPMKLFTLFTSDARALAYATRERAHLRRMLARVEGQLEFGLRLTFDERSARAEVERRHAEAGPGGGPTGAAYLRRKRDILDAGRVQVGLARAEADRLYRAISRYATEARRRTATEQASSGSRLVLDAAFLVPVRRANTFRAALDRHTARLQAAGTQAALTGPWPAYNFIDAPERAPLRKRSTPAPRGRLAAKKR